MATSKYTPKEVKVVTEEKIVLEMNAVEADYLYRLLASNIFGGSDVQHGLYLALSKSARNLDVPADEQVKIEYKHHSTRGGDRLYATDPGQSSDWPF